MTSTEILDRRSGRDRRANPDRRMNNDRRAGGDRRQSDPQSGAMFDMRSAAVSRFLEPRLAEPSADGAAALNRPNLAPLFGGGADISANPGSILADIVAGFYEASVDAKLWPDVLARFRDAVHADTAAVATHDFERQRGYLEHSVSIDAMYVTAYADFYSQQNSWLRNPDQFRLNGAVWTGQQLIDDGDLISSDFYRYWLRPQDIFHHLFGIIDASGPRSSFIVFARAHDKGAFWQDDILLLRHLLPSLRRAMRAGDSFRRTIDIQRITLDTIDTMPIGVVVLNGSGAILTANRAAAEILEAEDAMFIGAGGLGIRLPGGRIRLRDHIAEPAGRIAGDPADLQSFTVPREPERRPLSLVLAPVKDRTRLRSPDDPAAILFIADPERPHEVDPRRLIRLYGLSRAEARVAALLARGLRLEQVAESLELTYETVRKHLKQIFSKTGTDRQAELIRTLASGPASLRL